MARERAFDEKLPHLVPSKTSLEASVVSEISSSGVSRAVPKSREEFVHSVERLTLFLLGSPLMSLMLSSMKGGWSATVGLAMGQV